MHCPMDWHYLGGTSNKVGLWGVCDNYEGSSSEPLYRSLQIKKY
ncbi:MAG: hypothetical protein CENE_01096 [Candidatus Celerinatantimonas neptuna]|nr:MAG: hypothetical protein CENE_01096 [Candidatus Celerinatantimonas neptuna]